jgi:pimeloyl-ACP methyl ester carboxylesterase
VSPLRAVTLGLAVAAVIALGGPFLLQDRLLYFPQRATVGELAQGGLAAWPSADDLRGLLAQPQGVVRATAIVFHGNAGHAGHRAFYAAALAPLGVRVILAEYPGYGPRRGKLGEAPLIDDAVHSIKQAYRHYGPPLLVVGESLGAGVAAAAAARQPERVAALMLITPWDRLDHVAAHHYPWLPVRWLLHDRYDSAAHLAAFERPVAVLVAERDDIVPARFGMALHEALASTKRLWVLPGAGHNDWPAHVDGALWQQMIHFLLGQAPRP